MFLKRTIQVGLLGAVSLFSTYAIADWQWPMFDFTTYSNALSNEESQAKLLSTKAPSLSPEALKMALHAYNKVKQQGLVGKELLTVVDYSRPSTEPRLWVFDLRQNNLLFHEYVAHGKNSGDNVANSFSNSPSSLKSSLGVFVTKQTYSGKHGYSLRLSGLESGINDLAERRAIVVHSANYVGEEVARKHARMGKTWGCFGLSPRAARPVIDTIKGGTVIFAYYPDRNYVKRSQFLA